MSARILEVLPNCEGVQDAGTLLPERLSGMAEAAIGDLPLPGGKRVADCFAVSGTDSDHLAFKGASMQLENVGRGMRSGRITVEGDCGNFAGLGMRGGSISISGNAGDFAACEMRAGLLEIRGNARDFAGGALPGSMQGMRGGHLLIHGSAGDRTGDRMRRGLILVAGNVGDYCGSRMLAGTIVVRGRAGAMAGIALRRGTLLFGHQPAEVPACFQDSGTHDMLFIRLMERELERLGPAFAGFLPLGRGVRRYCGDMGAGGTGEILVRA